MSADRYEIADLFTELKRRLEEARSAGMLHIGEVDKRAVAVAITHVETAELWFQKAVDG